MKPKSKCTNTLCYVQMSVNTNETGVIPFTVRYFSLLVQPMTYATNNNNKKTIAKTKLKKKHA